MFEISSNFKDFGKKLEEQVQEHVKHHKIRVECPKCTNVFHKSLKEIGNQDKIICARCSASITFDLSKIDKKFL